MGNYKYTSAAIVIAVILCSCNELDGKIEIGKGDKVYLINGSKTKQISFTVKITQTINDSIVDYGTEVIPLVPGGETYIGVKDSVVTIKPKRQYDLSAFDNVVNGKNKDFNTDTGRIIEKQLDSIVRYKYNYEVTGQSEFKDKISN